MMEKLSVALVSGIGLEGHGATTYTTELASWLESNGIRNGVYTMPFTYGIRGKRNYNFNNIEDFQATTMELSEYRIVLFTSFPYVDTKNADLFMELVREVSSVKVFVNLSRYFTSFHLEKRWYGGYSMMRMMDAFMTFRPESDDFSRAMWKAVPRTPLLPNSNGMDFGKLGNFVKPFETMRNRLTYLGRNVKMKDPMRVVEMQPYLEREGISSEMMGITRAIGSTQFYYSDITKQPYVLRENLIVFSTLELMRKGRNLRNQNFLTTYDGQKVKDMFEPRYRTMVDKYERFDGLDWASNSKFGAEFFNLKQKQDYCNDMEYVMAEMVAIGMVPLFDRDWAINTFDSEGKRVLDHENFAIYTTGGNRDSYVQAVKTMGNLMENEQMFEERRANCLRVSKLIMDSNIVNWKIVETLDGIKKKKSHSLFDTF